MEYPNICFRCGLCCTRYRILVTAEEAARIADCSGIDIDEFAEESGASDWFGPDAFLLRQRNGACFFLKYVSQEENLCTIHVAKPAVCQEWSAGLYRQVCRHGLAKYWQLRLNHDGELEGDDKQIRKFQGFLRSL
jgi:Fe-S-cluster containining protein